ncbi:MAG: CHAT domain-containing protein [Betaproteobacteria bacterium]
MRAPRRIRAAAAALVVLIALDVRPAAQDRPADDPQFTALLATAKKAYDDRRLDAAAAGYQALLDLARERHDELWESRATLGLGSVDYWKADYVRARSRLLEALTTFDRLGAAVEIGRANLLLGNVAAASGDLREAAARYTLAIPAFEAAGDVRGKVTATINRLRFSNSDLDAQQLEAPFRAVEKDARALGDRALEASVLHSWSDHLFTRGDYEAAIEKLDVAVGLLAGGADEDELGTIYNSLGRLYRVHGQVAVALRYQLKALAIHEKLNSPRNLIQSLNAVAATYQFLGDAAHASVYFERALALAERSAAPGIVSFLRASYGDFLVVNGNTARGREMLAQSLAAASPYQQTLRYAQLAYADLKLGRPRDALAEAQQAMDHCAATSRVDCANAQLTRASAELALDDDAAALSDQQAVLRVIEEMHRNLAASDFLKQGFEQLWTPTYSLAIDLLTRSGQTRAALETAELGRSRALLDLLASRAERPAARPLPLVLRGQAGGLPSTAAASSATADDLAATAARLHSTLLVYWVGENKIYAWTVAPDGRLDAAVTPMSRVMLDTLIRSTSAFAPAAPSAAVTPTRGGQSIPLVMKPSAAWTELYDLLIQPIARSLPAARGSRLTVIPHGPLIDVPFAALRDHRGRYLIERYAIHELPAGAMLDYIALHRHPRARSGTALLVADPARPASPLGEPALPRLPGADAEVRAIAALLPPARTTVLSGEAATEPRVLKAVAHRTLLHFATHGIVSDTNPLSSFLALGRPDDNSLTGRLTVQEIYGLSLDADLVVLSACRSGAGDTSGDGIAAMARAFFYAGASSLVVSLWDVADEPTNRLLPAFYRAWLGGADKAAALRTAQLHLLAELRAGRVRVHTRIGDVVLPEDPTFWAGFVLLGEPN